MDNETIIPRKKVTHKIAWRIFEKIEGSKNHWGKLYTKSMVHNWLYKDIEDPGIEQAYEESLKDMGLK